jgi:hypothetical protein
MEGDVVKINDVSNNPGSLQYVTTVRSSEPNKASESRALDKAVESTDKAIEEPPFYERQEEPWLTDAAYKDLPDPEIYYRAFEHSAVQIDLFLMRLSYERFMGDFSQSHPDIASKHFGFTLGDDAALKIIDYDNSLTEDERNTLVAAFNDFGLTSQLQGMARKLMEFVDHDQCHLNGRYQLDLSNFQYTIDFGRILACDFKEIGHEWKRQIEANAEKLDTSSISVTA